MKKIWAPWRNEYITMKKTKTCIFCIGKKSTNTDRDRFVLKRGKSAFSMLNKYPYNNAHIMIAPYRHVRSFAFLNERELLDMMRLVKESMKIIDKKLKPHGYNVGANVGSVAGAGFAGHVHIHVVPRWKGDTNFMPVTSDTKVISGSLAETWRLLKC